MQASLEFDEIGYWSEVKLEIIRDYAAAYSRILNSNKLPHIYVDAFAGAGQHISKSSGEFVAGSPLNALNVKPPFREYHFIDLNAAKVMNLQRLSGSRPDVKVYEGDCNQILLREIFPTLKFESYRRALCLLDPYGLNLNWDVIFQAGQLGTIDIFLNFPVMGMNRNALWRNREKLPPEKLKKMTSFWGDESWKDVAYENTDPDLFGNVDVEKLSNDRVANAFRARLIDVAGFQRVPEPLPMRNSKGSVVYYLFFASQKNTAENIVTYIFDKFGRRTI